MLEFREELELKVSDSVDLADFGACSPSGASFPGGGVGGARSPPPPFEKKREESKGRGENYSKFHALSFLLSFEACGREE